MREEGRVGRRCMGWDEEGMKKNKGRKEQRNVKLFVVEEDWGKKRSARMWRRSGLCGVCVGVWGV